MRSCPNAEQTDQFAPPARRCGVRLGILPLLAVALAGSPAISKPQEARNTALTADAVNQAQWSAPSLDNQRAGREARGKHKQSKQSTGRPDSVMIKAAVLLDRAGFSPGAIDGLDGDNFANALRAFQQANGLESAGKLDEATWTRLTASSQDDVVRRYTIAAADVEGPFVAKVPRDFLEMSKLEKIAYRSPAELLAEKFHTSEKLLAALNKGESLGRADAQIVVPNVQPIDDPAMIAAADRSERPQTVGFGGPDKAPQAMRLEVDKKQRAIRVFGRDDKMIAFYPVSIGSDDKPAPSGTFKVTGVKRNPYYRYDPKYAFKGQKAKKPVDVRPGPNSPVGLVWIGLSAPSYGLHGTPEPDKIGRTESHGCVRLTNWDALALAKLVRKGTPVAFLD